MQALRRKQCSVFAGIAGLLASAGIAAANVDYVAPMNDPIEQAITLKTVADKLGAPNWDIAEVAPGGRFYKGMDVVCSKVLPNADINNRYVQAPTWLGDPAVANDYAIRSTAKVYIRNQIPVPAKLDVYDPQAATVAEYQAIRPLRLLVLIDKINITNMLAMIKSAGDRQLGTGIGVYIAGGAWHDGEIENPADLNEALRMLGRPDLRAVVDRYIAEHGDIPLGMTSVEIDFMRNTLVGQGWAPSDAARQAARRNQRTARKIVDDLYALQRESFVVRFATGFGMTWDDQKRALGETRVANRQLTNVTGFPIKDVYSLKYPNQQGAFATIGPSADDFNRISLMDRDLELVQIIKKYVNVDGYWAPEVPSLWHRGGKFHSEVALIYPKQAVEFTGKCREPMAPSSTVQSTLDGYDDE